MSITGAQPRKMFSGVATRRMGASPRQQRTKSQITFQCALGTTHIPYLRRGLQCIAAVLAIQSCRWHIRMVRDAEMKRLHAESLDIPTTTDVLTFDLRDAVPEKGHEGDPVELDTVICLDEARRRAAELGHPLQNELLLYCLHSLLHVQGYSDAAPGESKRMHAREDALLTHIGIGPVFKTKNAKRKTQNVRRPQSKIENRKSRIRKAVRR